jgi:hypothetical protein
MCMQCRFKLKTNILQKDDRIVSRNCQSDLQLRLNKVSLLIGKLDLLFAFCPFVSQRILPLIYVLTNHARAAFSKMASYGCIGGHRIASLPSFFGRGAALIAVVTYAIIAHAAASSFHRTQYSSSSSPRSARTPDRQSAAKAAANAAQLSVAVGNSQT